MMVISNPDMTSDALRQAMAPGGDVIPGPADPLDHEAWLLSLQYEPPGWAERQADRRDAVRDAKLIRSR